MRRALLLLLAVVGASPAVRAQTPFFRGMSYTPWSQNALLTSDSDLSLSHMRADGVDTVSLNVFWFQDNATSSVITEDFNYYSASEPSVRYAIREIHMRGMKALLKPMVDLRDGNWRGTIPPSGAWFRAYGAFIDHWAVIATQEGVDYLCVGCEFNANQQSTNAWRKIVAGVRALYRGTITYASNWDSYTDVGWWDAVDFVGIDAYFPLTTVADPPQSMLNAAWNTRANTIGGWLTHKYPNKQLAFTEVGYQSELGTNMTPWSVSGGPVDVTEQRDCYRALLQAMWNRPWWRGAFWWNWETDPNAGGPNDTGFTPQGKPAEAIVRDYYKQ